MEREPGRHLWAWSAAVLTAAYGWLVFAEYWSLRFFVGYGYQFSFRTLAGVEALVTVVIAVTLWQAEQQHRHEPKRR